MGNGIEGHEAGFVSRAGRHIGRLVWEVVTAILPALAVALFVNVYVAEAVTVKAGPSMEPNLYRGYRVMTEKVSYRLHPPQRGDVVVVERTDGEESLIKRVVALPGEVVEVRGGHTLVNGRSMEEPWVTHFGGPSCPATVIPPAHVFILGDNRPVSRDSRAIGPVSMESIKGRAFLIYWPVGELKVMP
ncbi:MAG: signal peptidase I [Anaerolineae bacterium]